MILISKHLEMMDVRKTKCAVRLGITEDDTVTDFLCSKHLEMMDIG